MGVVRCFLQMVDDLCQSRVKLTETLHWKNLLRTASDLPISVAAARLNKLCCHTVSSCGNVLGSTDARAALKIAILRRNGLGGGMVGLIGIKTPESFLTSLLPTRFQETVGMER